MESFVFPVLSENPTRAGKVCAAANVQVQSGSLIGPVTRNHSSDRHECTPVITAGFDRSCILDERETDTCRETVRACWNCLSSKCAAELHSVPVSAF
jgi:hypothetical protein